METERDGVRKERQRLRETERDRVRKERQRLEGD